MKGKALKRGLDALIDMDAIQTEGRLRLLTQDTQVTAERAQNLNAKYQGDVSRQRLLDEMSREM